MARTINRLPAKKVENLKAPGYYADGGNLYFRVAEGGARGWIFRFRMNGRTRDAGLGPFPAVTLAVARETADKWRQIVASGKDPIEHRNEQRAAERVEAAKAMTFDDCGAAYIAAMLQQAVALDATLAPVAPGATAPGGPGGTVGKSSR